MNALQLRMFVIVLTVSSATAWSSPTLSATPATESRANAHEGAKVKPGQSTVAPIQKLPSIWTEDDIPAFLITDPCDTGDS